MRITSIASTLFSCAAITLQGCSNEYEDLSALHHQWGGVPNAIVGAPDAIYLSVGSQVERRDAEGGNPVVISSNENIETAPAAAYELALGDGYLYWLRATSDLYQGVAAPKDLRTEVVRVPGAGGTPEIVAHLEGTPTRRFVVKGDALFTCDAQAPWGDPHVSVVHIGDQRRSSITLRRGEEGQAFGCGDLFIDAAGVAHVSVFLGLSSEADVRWYKVTSEGNIEKEAAPIHPGTRWRNRPGTSNVSDLVSVDASGAEVILNSGPAVPFVAEGSTVYLTTGPGGGNRRTLECNTGGVSVIRDGKVPELLTKGQCGPRGFALTPKRVFWLDDRSILYEDGKQEASLKSLTR